MASGGTEIAVFQILSLYVNINVTQVSYLFCFYFITFLKFHHIHEHTEIVTGRLSGVSASLLPLNQCVFKLCIMAGCAT